MTEKLSFEDNTFDLIFHPVSNCYIMDIQPVWDECYRILKKNGILLAGFLTETGFLFNFDDSMKAVNKMPYNPLKGLDDDMIRTRIENKEGFMFSHTLEEQIGGQLKAGFKLAGIYDDRERPDERGSILAEFWQNI